MPQTAVPFRDFVPALYSVSLASLVIRLRPVTFSCRQWAFLEQSPSLSNLLLAVCCRLGNQISSYETLTTAVSWALTLCNKYHVCPVPLIYRVWYNPQNNPLQVRWEFLVFWWQNSDWEGWRESWDLGLPLKGRRHLSWLGEPVFCSLPGLKSGMQRCLHMTSATHGERGRYLTAGGMGSQLGGVVSHPETHCTHTI